LPDWRWPMLRGYNGFTSPERVFNWRLARWLKNAGALSPPRCCSICSSEEKVALHGENYADLTRSPALCSRCHMALHRRFSLPARWQDIARCHVRRGDEWFALIPAEAYDLADYLRRTRRSTRSTGMLPLYELIGRYAQQLPPEVVASWQMAQG
jgi:hypothetical protein